MWIIVYVDWLFDDLDVLDWFEQVKIMQCNWIGCLMGVVVLFLVRVVSDDGFEVDIEVFIMWFDILFGVMYLVLVFEYDLVDELVVVFWLVGVNFLWIYGGGIFGEVIVVYWCVIVVKLDFECQESREKIGVFLGSYVINLVNGELVLIFIVDYVLVGYGIGVIMVVLGYDQWDWDFVWVFGLLIVEVIVGGNILEFVYIGDGILVNLDYFNGMSVLVVKWVIVDWLEFVGCGWV